MSSDRGPSGRDSDDVGPGCARDVGGETDGRDDRWWEDQAVEAAEWLGACYDAAANGASAAEVGASPVAHPGLRGDLDALVGAVDGLVGCDPVGYAGSDLLEANVALRTQADRLAGVVAEFSRAFDVSGEWLLKARSPGARLAHRCRRSTADTNREIRLGRALERMPLVTEALAAGEIGECHARQLARFATNERTAELFTRDEEMLTGFARSLSWRGFLEALKAWELAADPDGAEDNAAADEANRRVDLSEGIDATGVLDGILTPVGYATLKTALDAVVDELFQQDWDEAKTRLGRDPLPHELSRTAKQRRHDALVLMAERSQTTTGRSTPLVSVLVGTDALTKTLCRIEQTGALVTPGTLARLFDDHRGQVLIERIVFEGSNRVIEVGEKRFFTGALRRAIEARDRTCQWPGCDHPAVACQIDHMIEHSEGGSTSQNNGQALCGPHNRLKERIRKLTARRRARPKPSQGDDADLPG